MTYKELRNNTYGDLCHHSMQKVESEIRFFLLGFSGEHIQKTVSGIRKEHGIRLVRSG
jgi:hypothetical protein